MSMSSPVSPSLDGQSVTVGFGVPSSLTAAKQGVPPAGSGTPASLSVAALRKLRDAEGLAVDVHVRERGRVGHVDERDDLAARGGRGRDRVPVQDVGRRHPAGRRVGRALPAARVARAARAVAAGRASRVAARRTERPGSVGLREQALRQAGEGVRVIAHVLVVAAVATAVDPVRELQALRRQRVRRRRAVGEKDRGRQGEGRPPSSSSSHDRASSYPPGRPIDPECARSHVPWSARDCQHQITRADAAVGPSPEPHWAQPQQMPEVIICSAACSDVPSCAR